MVGMGYMPCGCWTVTEGWGHELGKDYFILKWERCDAHRQPGDEEKKRLADDTYAQWERAERERFERWQQAQKESL